jgi:ATP-dependent Lon protease
VPKQIKNNGLGKTEIDVPDQTLTDLIRYYTKEAGVRGLDREVSKLARKVVRQRIEDGHKKIGGNDDDTVVITPDVLENYSGVRKFTYGLKEAEDRIGQVTGLAWTSVGGELLTIEAVSMPGKGKQIRTGSLGDVMQESIQAAMTVARSRAIALGIDPNFHEKTDLHIHVPEGATPKDGPSAGIGMCTALVSVLANVPVKADVAMTGEITLRGQVLQIGGLKEKLLAAHRGGIKTVIIPEENVADLKEIPDNVKADLEIKPVSWIDQVLDIALTYIPEPFVVQDGANSSEQEQGKEKNPQIAH